MKLHRSPLSIVRLAAVAFLAFFAFLAIGGASPVGAQGIQDFLKNVIQEASSQYLEDSHSPDHTGYYPYAAPPREADAASRNQHAYDVGYRVGQDDFHHHLSKHFVRHRDLFDDATHDAFASGYGAGYDIAREGASNRDRSYHPPVASREPVASDRYPSGYYPYASPPSGQSSAARNRHAYDVGFRVGQDDFNHGHSKHFTHHEKLFDKETRDSFAQGYEQGYDRARGNRGAATRPAPKPAPQAARIAVKEVQGGVEIVEGDTVVTRIKSAMPNVEATRLLNGDRLVVVKSRGRQGPASVELFDTRTGVLRDKILAYAIQGGRPSWAAGFEE